MSEPLSQATGWGKEDRSPIKDLVNGQGVSQQEILRWKAVARRFDVYGYQNPDKLDLYTFPRPQRTKDFLKGESEYSYRDGKLNPVNNPLKLIRPATLHSVDSFFSDNGQKNKSLRYYEDDPSKRGYEDTKDEENYMML
ncbi:MAG: hypothetical protein DPW11_03835 [bacterium]|nr:hypothetical protein [Candidatus Microgenomates bacterium CPR3]MCQ3944879.1 hypothetical protein [bacterium]RIK52250.1 MAG: hypothetical protein DCC61_00485 [Candidatus Microgenomates bacterium]